MDYRQKYELFFGKTPKGCHVHHIDGNKNNNHILNLIRLTDEDHWLVHFYQGDPVAINRKFVSGASEAGKKGGLAKKPNKRKGQKRFDYEIEAINYGIQNKRRTYFGENNPFFGKKHSQKTLEKFKSKTFSDETKTLMSLAAKKRLKDPTKHPMFGKKRVFTDEHREKLRQANLKRYQKEII